MTPSSASPGRCCGAPVQVFALAPPGEPPPGVTGEVEPLPALALHRCGGCGARAYVRAGVPVPREEAFVLLAGSFRRDGSTRAAPTAGRTAGPATSPDGAARTTRRAQEAPAASSEPTNTARPAARDLAGLLTGWTVLGTS